MSLLSDAVARAQALLFRGREEREFREEARLHLDLEIERNRGMGMTDAEARRPGAVMAAVLRQGAAVIGVGILLGVLGAAALSRVVASVVFHVSPLDPRALLAAGLVLAACGGVAAYLPARRAGSVDPRTALQ